MVFSLMAGLSFSAAASDDVTINILHTNDLHGRFYPFTDFHRSMIRIDQIAEIYNTTDNAILVDVGDAISGTPLAAINEGMDPILLMMAAGYSVMAPGNHEFNYGSARLLELAEIAAKGGLNIISANVYVEATGEKFLPAVAVQEIAGIKVGFFGLTPPSTTWQSSPANSAGLEFKDILEAAEAAIAELRDEEVDIVVALAHLFRDREDEKPNDIVSLLEALTDKPDLLIEGHDHRLGDVEVSGVPVVGAGEYGANLGKVSITINSDGEITDITPTLIKRDDTLDIEGDPEVKALVEEKQAAVDLEYSKVVAASSVDIPWARGDDDGSVLGVRNSEMGIGNLIADAIRNISGADIAIMNGGGIREPIKTGDLTKYNLFLVMPFLNTVVVKEITPAVIFATIENGLSGLPATFGGFPQISGMNVIYNAELPVGERVVSIMVDGTALDRDDEATIYTIAINNNMATGGDRYTMLIPLEDIAELGSLDSVFIEYIADELGGSIKAEDAKIDGRLLNADGWAAPELILALKADLVPDGFAGTGWRHTTTRLSAAAVVSELIQTILGKTLDEIAEEEEWDLDDNPFTDVDDKNITFLYHAGVTRGTSATTFSPDGSFNRAEFVTMVGRAARDLFDAEIAGEHSFTDAIPDWAEEFVGFFFENEIVRGNDADTFGGAFSLTNQVSIALTWRTFVFFTP
jgi:2',3'-cyclic-nucleotide 2'-phosphodiesterase (5'-nucleotidase family)